MFKCRNLCTFSGQTTCCNKNFGLWAGNPSVLNWISVPFLLPKVWKLFSPRLSFLNFYLQTSRGLVKKAAFIRFAPEQVERRVWFILPAQIYSKKENLWICIWLPKALIWKLAAILPSWHLWHKPFLCCDYCCVSVRPTLCCCSVDKAVPVPDGTADVVDVFYVNIITWSMGCRVDTKVFFSISRNTKLIRN